VANAAVQIPVTLGPTLQIGKRPTVIGAILAGDLVQRFEIPYRDHARKTGYQREASTTRINQLMRDLTERRADLPTALLLNIREFHDQNLEKYTHCSVLNIDDERMYVVDGQHRVLALRRLIAADPNRWEAFLVPFVCMLGATWREEMEQFYIVNSTAKSVRTDLALDLLKQRAESDQGTMHSLIERGQAWKVRGETLAEALAKTPLWLGRIRFPGDPVAQTTIASSGFVSSLKRLLGTPFFGAMSQDNQAKLLAAYWQGIAKCLPEVFENPNSFALQKSIGTTVLHNVLVPTVEYLRSAGRSLTESDSYADALREPLSQLEGDNQEGNPIRGSDFWRSGPHGAAGSYSSSAGQRVLIAKISQLLPEVTVD
jgi:DGQHR domain-containing protein